MVLATYLLGVAIGAELGKRLCRGERDLYLVSARILFVAALFDFAAPYLVAEAFQFRHFVSLMVLVPTLVCVALLKSMIFPIAHHLGSSRSQDTVGSSVSKVYFANILGSAGGPLLTGFVLLQHLPLQQCMHLMAALTFLLALFCLSMSGHLPRYALASVAVALAMPFILPRTVLPRLISGTRTADGPVDSIIENRYGIIHTLKSSDGDDSVFGGNIYDGHFNIDLLRDSNKIRRAYVLAALHPAPERVLVIGLSSGSWTKVASGFPGVDTVDVLEINPGYVDLIRSRPEVSSLLSDPHIHLVFDDARRWLKRNPSRTYDLVVMNTTFHWRAYTTLLLSDEFLKLLKSHLKPGGLVAYNATGSPDAAKTASGVFRYVYRLDSFLYAADYDMLRELPRGRARMAAIRLDSRNAVDFQDAAVVRKVDETLASFEPFSAIEAHAPHPLEVITDQNLLTEYRYGNGLFSKFFQLVPR